MFNEYQKGSIFGAVIVAVAFFAALSTIPYPLTHSINGSSGVSELGAETFWERAWDPIVLVTVVQVGLFILNLFYIQQGLNKAAIAADAATRQAKAAEIAFEKRERPYLFVFGAKRMDSKPLEYGDGFYHFLEYEVANYGVMPAKLVKTSEGFEISDKGEPPWPLQIGDEHSLSTSPILAPGERRKIRAVLPTGMAQGDAFLDGEDDPDSEPISQAKLITPDGFELFFRVVIEYEGPFSHEHQTGATWLNDRNTWNFDPRGGEKYNYAR
jgi:hypothetical protein